MAKNNAPPEHNTPNNVVVLSCVLALVILGGIDAISPTYSVPTIVYAIIAGILFGVGGIRDVFGGGKK